MSSFVRVPPHDLHGPSLSPWSPPEENTSTVTKKVPKEYAESSIKKANNPEDAWAYMYPSVAGTFLPQQHQASLDIRTSRPKLETPLVDPKQLRGMDQPMGQLVGHVSKSEQGHNDKQQKPYDKNLAEIALLQCYIQLMKAHNASQETDAEITMSIAQKHQDANQKIRQEYFSKLDEVIAKNKQNGILKWINWVLYGALAFVGLGSLVLTLTASVVTGGAALPLFLTTAIGLLKATLAIASGSTTIFSGVLKYQTNKIIGVLEEIKFDRTMNNEKIKLAMDEMRQSMEVIGEIWKHLHEVTDNWQQAVIQNIH